MTLNIFFTSCMIDTLILRFKPIFPASWESPLSSNRHSDSQLKTRLLNPTAHLLCQFPVHSPLYSIHQQILLQNTFSTLLQWLLVKHSVLSSPDSWNQTLTGLPASLQSSPQPAAREDFRSCKSYHALPGRKSCRFLIQTERHLLLTIMTSNLSCLLHWLE